MAKDSKYFYSPYNCILSLKSGAQTHPLTKRYGNRTNPKKLQIFISDSFFKFFMQKALSFSVACLGWFAVITQFVLMINNRTVSIPETLVRFFSFFTILTNIIVAIYFSMLVYFKNNNLILIRRSGMLTAITVYIFMVGTVYQVMLRHTWNPEGMQFLVDELLHSIIPVLVILFWALYENKKDLRYSEIPIWAIYPITYLVLVLIRGKISNFYPYPFIKVSELGLKRSLINSVILLIIFLFFALIFVSAGRFFSKKKKTAGFNSF
jgi:hypothetical protein